MLRILRLSCRLSANTSANDAGTEAVIPERLAFLRRHTTLVAGAGRIATVRRAGVTHTLDNGPTSASGTVQESRKASPML
jgi:ABC-type multidrug transport system fused ATPase/permease subunit